MQATSKSMLEEIRNIRRSLEDNFEQASDGYTRKMFRFSSVAEGELHELRDGIVAAEKDLRQVQTFYGEGEDMGRIMPSQEFFGIFRTFTSSYKVSHTVGYCTGADEISFVKQRIANGPRKPRCVNAGRKLEPLSPLKRPAVRLRQRPTLSMLDCSGSSSRARPESRERRGSTRRPCRQFLPIWTFQIS
jgi:hypothetical protein